MNEHQIAPLNQASDRSISDVAERQPNGLGQLYSAQWQPRVADEEGFISIRFFLRALAQWWYVALPVGLVLAVISAAIVMLTFTPVYRASAMLKIASYTPYIAYTTNEHPMKPEEFTETQIELLRSPLVLEQLMTKPEIAEMPEVLEQENPTTWLANELRVVQVSNSELYNVYLDGKSPENSAMLVNAILDEYFAVRERDEESQTERVIELLDQEKKVRAEEIQELREKMRELNQDSLVSDAEVVGGTVAGDKASQMTQLNDMRDRAVEANIDRRLLELQIQAIEETMSKDTIEVPKTDVEVAISESDQIQQLRNQIALKQASMAKYEVTSPDGKNSRGYKRLEREIEGYQRSLAAAAAQTRPEIQQSLQEYAALERQDLMNQLSNKLELATELEKLLNENVRALQLLVGDSGDHMMELEFTRAELTRAERVFEMIAERHMALQTERRAPGRVALMRRAEQPAGPVESLPLRNLAAVVFLSGCFPFGLALLWEMSVRRIGDSEQLSQHSSLPVVGEIARLPIRFRSLTSRGSRAMNLFEESIDSLRVGLILPDQFQGIQVIAVTSAVHSEGKSSIASQLAVSIGRSIGEPILLIDGDLRSPDVHHIFDVPNNVGFAAVLEGKASLEDAIITSWSDTVHLLPAGHLKKNPHKLMSVGSLRKMLDELRKTYRFIVIDTPPILSASEALMLAKVADGTVLSTRRNVSRESQVRIAYERLMKSGARPMGAVFNGVPTRSYAQTYGSYDYSRSFE